MSIYCEKGSKVRIGDDVSINAYKVSPSIINAFEDSVITIGNKCLVSNGVELHTSDYHSLMKDGERYNRASDITIGDHTWIGLRTVILKGVNIAPNTVVGACSLVTSSFKESNILLVGIPARKVKEQINWEKKRL